MSATPLERISPEPPAVTSQQLDLVKRTIANGATPAELQLFLYDCQRQGVHPLDKLLHFTKRGGKYTPVTSIDLMRTRAADTGEYAGSDDAEFTVDDDGTLIAATVTVWRLVQGHRCAFTATARFAEYVPPPGQDAMWRKMPRTMTAKCAEALALRKGFPRQLAGLYAAEELEQAGELEREPVPATEDEPESAKPARKPEPVPPAAPVAAPTTTLTEPVYITNIEPAWKDAKGPAKAFLYHSGMTAADKALPIYQTPVKATAEACYQAKTPVRIDIAVSATSGRPYVKAIVPADDVPFTSSAG